MTERLEAAFDGNAALNVQMQIGDDGEWMQQEKLVRKRKKREAVSAKPFFWKNTAVKAVGGILLAALFVVLMLMSYAELVVIHNDTVALRSELSQLKTEETKLMAQYELAYDLQEIENTMLLTGQMTKAQAWQVYTLEMAEPDSVEYFKGNLFTDRLVPAMKTLVNAVKEYF